jgi:hypothetical protein
MTPRQRDLLALRPMEIDAELLTVGPVRTRRRPRP